MKRAWRVTWDHQSGVTAASTRGQAIFRLFSELKSLGYRPKLGEIKCRRAPEWDAWALVNESCCVWDEQYLPA